MRMLLSFLFQRYGLFRIHQPEQSSYDFDIFLNLITGEGEAKEGMHCEGDRNLALCAAFAE